MKLVNLETAKALQELGYDGEYAEIYNEYEISNVGTKWAKTPIEIPAPRLDDAAYWIRERHRLSIRISYIMLNECWFYDMLHLETNRYHDGDDWLYPDYDSALEAAVNKAIEIIKNNL